MTDIFDKFVPGIQAREGSAYTNRPADAGGPTRWGITAKTLGAWRKLGRDATPQEVQALEWPEAYQIYRQEYFVSPGWQQIAAFSPIIAEELTDTGINMGVETAATFLQRALNVLNRNGQDYANVALDGQAGPATRAALFAFLTKRGTTGVQVMLKALNCLQGAAYIELAERRRSDQENVFGWLAQRVGIAA